MIASIGAQLRDCRIFVSDEVVLSVACGARIHHKGGKLVVRNGILRNVQKCNKESTNEYISVMALIRRWKCAIRKKKI